MGGGTSCAQRASLRFVGVSGAPLQGPPGRLKGPRRVSGPSRGLQGPPGASGVSGGGFSKPRRLFRDLILGFGVFPSRGKSMYIVHIWPTGVAGGRAVPPDVQEEPGRALYVHSP